MVKLSPVLLPNKKGVKFCEGSIDVVGSFVVRALKTTDLRILVHPNGIPFGLVNFVADIIITLHHKNDLVDII